MIACTACGWSEARDLLIVMERAGLHRVRPGLRPDCLRLVSPGGHAADAIALLVPPTPEDEAAFWAAVAPHVHLSRGEP
jgi:hypothetical protein